MMERLGAPQTHLGKWLKKKRKRIN
jgi:hypothetical protein